MRRCLLLFARAPREEAAQKHIPRAEVVFGYTRRRVARVARALGVDLVIAGPAAPELGARHVLPQEGPTFAARLEAAFARARALGYESIAAVPQDVPSLDAATLARAFRALDEGQVVLGPSPDGGVYLLGLPGGQGPAALLAGVRWHSASVSRDLADRSGQVLWLPPRDDLDHARALARFLDGAARAPDPELAALARRLRPAPAPHRPAPPGYAAAPAPCRPRGPPAV